MGGRITCIASVKTALWEKIVNRAGHLTIICLRTVSESALLLIIESSLCWDLEQGLL